MTTKTQPSLPSDIIASMEEMKNRVHGESYLIAVLQMIQNRFGYLSREHMDEVSRRMQIPSVRVTGVATFYHFFSLKPRGQTRITVCMGTACYVRGADRVLARLEELLGIKTGEVTQDGKFSIEAARCLGACALAPVVVVNKKVCGNVKPDDVEKLLKDAGFTKPSSVPSK